MQTMACLSHGLGTAITFVGPATEPAAAYTRRMAGLSLLRTIEYIDAAHVITEAVAGLSDGRLFRLRLVGQRRLERDEVEAADVQPQGEGQLLRYPIEDLEDGYYEAHSTCDERTVYFQIRNAEAGRLFDDDKHVLRAMKRG